MLSLLVLEGNAVADRRRIAETAGAMPAESYAAVLRSLAPRAAVDIATPADASLTLPQPLDAYDGIAITGSALNIHQRKVEALRQIDLVREIFVRGLPMFGSCWGLQLATVAAGGEVGPNSAGREVGFARRITLTPEGRAHPMHVGRAAMFDAPAIHSDTVTRLPQSATVTAWNAMCEVQAAEIRFGLGLFWGVQYHPEYRLHDVATVIRRYGQILVDEGFFADLDALARYAADLSALDADERRGDLAWKFALHRDILSHDCRQTELRNWIASLEQT